MNNSKVHSTTAGSGIPQSRVLTTMAGIGGERGPPFEIIGVEQGVDHTTFCDYLSLLAFVSYSKTGWIQPVGIISQLSLPAFWEYTRGLRHI